MQYCVAAMALSLSLWRSTYNRFGWYFKKRGADRSGTVGGGGGGGGDVLLSPQLQLPILRVWFA